MIQQTLHLYQRAYRGLAPSVWILAGVMFINRCGTMVLPYMALYLKERLHYSITDTGIVMAIYGAGSFVGTFLGGRLADRFGFYYVQLLSLLFSGAALLALQFITSFPILCASVFAFTLFGDAFRPANQTAIAYYSDAETRTRALSLNRLAINLGWSIGGGLGGWLASIDYSLLFWADGLTCLLAGVVLWLNLPVPVSSAGEQADELLPASNAPHLRAGLKPYQDTLFMTFVGCVTLYLLSFMQFFFTVSVFLKEELHVSVRMIGLLMSLNGLLIVAFEMALVYRLEQQKRQKFSLITLGVSLTAMAYTVLALPGLFKLISAGLLFAFLFVVIVTFGEMLAVPFLQSFTIERASPATRGQYLSFNAMGSAVAQTTAPVMGSLLIAHAGFSVHWLVTAGLSLVSASGFWWLGKQLKRSTEQGIPADH